MCVCVCVGGVIRPPALKVLWKRITAMITTHLAEYIHADAYRCADGRNPAQQEVLPTVCYIPTPHFPILSLSHTYTHTLPPLEYL